MLTSILLAVALILCIVAIIMAVTNRPWVNWVIGGAIALAVWAVLTYVVH